MVPQELVFDPFFTVRETLEFQAGYFGLRDQDAWIDEILHHLDLTSKANANMRSLSGGMKRRVLVGQALVHKPPVIVLDEPTAGVDVELRQSLWRFIRKLNRDGHTIILTTHYLEEAEALCGRIAMLKAGPRRRARLHAEPAVARRGITCRLVAARVPAAWQSRVVRADGAIHHIGLESYAELEQLLAALREEDIAIVELALEETDLEQVFLKIMRAPEARVQDLRAGERRRAEPAHKDRMWQTTPSRPRLGDAASTRSCCASGRWPSRRSPRRSSRRCSTCSSSRTCSKARVSVYDGRVVYTAFLVPGLVMMSVLQNCVRQLVVVAHPVEDHRQPDLRAAAAAVGG